MQFSIQRNRALCTITDAQRERLLMAIFIGLHQGVSVKKSICWLHSSVFFGMCIRDLISFWAYIERNRAIRFHFLYKFQLFRDFCNHITKCVSHLQDYFMNRNISLLFGKLQQQQYNAKCGGWYDATVDSLNAIAKLNLSTFSIHLFIYPKWDSTLMNLENQEKILPT